MQSLPSKRYSNQALFLSFCILWLLIVFDGEEGLLTKR